MKHITILSGQTKIQLSPAKAYSGNVEEYQLSVNGQEVSLQQNQQVTLSSQEQITAYYSEDHLHSQLQDHEQRQECRD